MEILSLLVIVVILFVVLSIKGNITDKLADLNMKIDLLSEHIKKISVQQPPIAEIPLEKKQRKQESISHQAQPIKPELEIRPTPVEPPKPIQKEEVKPMPQPITEREPVFEQIRQTTPEVKSDATSNTTPEAGRDYVHEFLERNPDLEKFIGENLANKIGIGILVLGIGFFVKYAIDQQWINEIGRVFIGILCGGILLGVAHRLRRTFNAFSSVLVGGGIAVLYFTIAIAFHEYAIFSQTIAFMLMVVITAFTIVLSIGYNRVELAVLAILGGFGSPFMVSTGEGNYVVLFTYVLILNAGMLVLAYHKKWKIINIICYLFTILLFGAWLGTRFDGLNIRMVGGALIFATLFYLVFFAMNIINNLKERVKFEALEITMLLSNTFLYFSAGMIILNSDPVDDFKGLFTATLGVFNFVFAFLLYKNMRADRNLVFMLIGLVLTFISLAAPIQLKGNYITLFWAAEAVLLLWLSKKSGISLMKTASIIINFLMCISLMMDWNQIYIHNIQEVPLLIILNKGYITSVVSLISLALTYYLLGDVEDEKFFRNKDYRIAITIVSVVFLYVGNLLELKYHIANYVHHYATESVIVGTYNMLFIAIMLLVEGKLNIPDGVKRMFPIFGIIAMLAYLFYYHPLVIETRNNFLERYTDSTAFIFHYFMIVLLVISAVLSLRKINAMPGLSAKLSNIHWWVYITFFVFILSAELDHTVLLIAFDAKDSVWSILNQNHKIGFPILWGLLSFILIAVGLARKIKTIRIISLALLLVTLLKLFLFDLKGISEGGKIAAFISLGILLLVVSFMYQRLKKLLLDDNAREQTEKTV